MKNKKLDDKTPLTWEQIQEKIKEYKINHEGVKSIKRLLGDNFPITADILDNIASLHYMTKEILAAKIKEYKVPKWAVDNIYALLERGTYIDEITIEMLKDLGEHGRDGEGAWSLHMLN
jgi:hypothetical protein